MNFTGLLFLLVTQFISGRGLLKLFRLQLSFVALSCFSMLLGVILVSLVPCIMQLMHIPLTTESMYVAISIMTVLCAIPLILQIKQTRMPEFWFPKLYEIPFMLVLAGFIVISAWRCFYFPPYPRDVLTGTELLAEYAVREKTMISSVFNVDLRLGPTANNIFKSPFITGLQIVYKLMVQPFGQVWLTVLFISFTIWLYSVIRERIHPFLAGVLMLIFLSVPDLFAYTYIILYDYSNMVFFFPGFYFLIDYLENRRINELLWVTTLFCIATYIRSETLVIVGLMIPLIVYQLYKKQMPGKQIAVAAAIILAGPVVMNFIVSNIFIKNFIPIRFNIEEMFNPEWYDITQFFGKANDLITGLMFSSKGALVYGHFFYFFVGVVVIDVIWPRKFNREAKLSLWGIGIVIFALCFLSHVIPSHTIINSAKRGLFKVIPLMLLYMANSGALQKLSEFLDRKEKGIKKQPEPRPATVSPKPVAAPKQKKR